MPLSPDERAEIDAMKAKVDSMHRALLEPPPGGGDSLLRQLVLLNETARNGQWAAKWIIRGILTCGGVVAAWLTIKGAK